MSGFQLSGGAFASSANGGKRTPGGGRRLFDGPPEIVVDSFDPEVSAMDDGRMTLADLEALPGDVPAAKKKKKSSSSVFRSSPVMALNLLPEFTVDKPSEETPPPTLNPFPFSSELSASSSSRRGHTHNAWAGSGVHIIHTTPAGLGAAMDDGSMARGSSGRRSRSHDGLSQSGRGDGGGGGLVPPGSGNHLSAFGRSQSERGMGGGGGGLGMGSAYRGPPPPPFSVRKKPVSHHPGEEDEDDFLFGRRVTPPDSPLFPSHHPRAAATPSIRMVLFDGGFCVILG